MKKITIIGATGSLGRVVREDILNKTDYNITLFSRSADRLTIKNREREEIIVGDVYSDEDLDNSLKNSNVVFAALTGDLGGMADKLVKAVKRNDVEKLIFITSMGIYNEIPASIGERGNLKYNPTLQTYRDAADVIEATDFNYTIIRPGWFDNGNDTNYEVTLKGEDFGGRDVSRKSISDLVLRLTEDYTLYAQNSVGINRA